MAAITTLDTFSGSDSGTITGWDNILGTGTNAKEASGEAQPVNTAADMAIGYSSGFTEVYDSSNSKGIHARMLLGGGTAGLFNFGSKIGIIYDYDDDNNYREAVLEIGALTIGIGQRNDEVKLYKTVAGTTSEVGAGTTLKLRQTTPGDMRIYYAKEDSTLSITKIDNQHFVRLSVFDKYLRHDQADLTIRHETDTPGSTTGQVGFKIYANSDITVKSFQAQLIDAKFLDPAGSDSNNGTLGAPYGTWNKLVENVSTNMFGIVEAGQIWNTVNNLSDTFPSGWVSYEDAPYLTGRAGEEPEQLSASGLGTWHIKAGAIDYYTLHGFRLDGEDGEGWEGDNVVKIWSQNAVGVGTHSKYWRFQDMVFERAVGGANVYLETCNVTAFASDTHTSADLIQSHHLIDCESKLGNSGGGGGPGATHGIYHSHGWGTCIEFCDIHDNEGNGGKNAFGLTSDFPLTVLPSNDCTTRHNNIYDNNVYGWYQRGGDNMEQAYNFVWDNGLVGLGAFSATGQQTIHHNVVFRCGTSSTDAGIGVHNGFGADATGVVDIFYNTIFDCAAYGFRIYTNGGGLTRNITFGDNVVHDSGTADIFIDANSTHASNTTPNNHVTSDGDPGFENEGFGVEDFNLKSTSPLIGAGTVRGAIDYKYAIDQKLFSQNSLMAIGAYNFEYVGATPQAIAAVSGVCVASIGTSFTAGPGSMPDGSPGASLIFKRRDRRWFGRRH